MLEIWLWLSLALTPPAPVVQVPPLVQALPPVPFAGWILPGLVYLRHAPRTSSELAGALRRGDVVEVTQVVADETGAQPWALVAGGGALRLAAIRPGSVRDPGAELAAADANFAYARVRQPNTPVFAGPDAKTAVRNRQKAGRLLAFAPEPALLTRGWLHHAGGGYLRLSDVQPLTPSPFVGEPHPHLQLAMLRRAAQPQPGAPKLARYARAPVLAEAGNRVRIAAGQLPRSAVRIA